MNRLDRHDRFESLRLYIGCIACRMRKLVTPCGASEIHHQNFAGLAGHKRLGDEFTIPLGAWHHRGVALPGWTAEAMERTYGPSLARNSRAFRAEFGTDDALREDVNRRIAYNLDPFLQMQTGKMA